MTQNIKNFIEEGEKEFDKLGCCCDQCERCDPLCTPTEDVLILHKQLQISLIKMIVDMCEENAEDMVLDSGADLKLIRLDTITSKLKDLIKE